MAMSQRPPSIDTKATAPFPRSRWLIPVSIVTPDTSALIGDPALFWVIHSAALIVLSLSILSSIAVLAHILDAPLPPLLHPFGGGLFREWTQPRPSTKGPQDPYAQARTAASERALAVPSTLDISSRVSMYIAFADIFWCTARFADHMYHVVTLRIPSVILGELIGFIVNILFGYHQLLSACLSAYAFVRVVKEKRVHLGPFDCILHFCSLGPSAVVAVVFAFLGGFGPSAFWSLANARTSSGIAVSFMAFFVSLLNALVATGCRYLISAKLEAALSAISSDVSSNAMTNSSFSSSAVSREDVQITQVANACIANQTRVASFTYIPLALATYAVAMFHAQGYIEPLSSLCTTICANVMGFGNAYGYFRNEAMKLELRKQVRSRGTTGNRRIC